VFKTSPDDDTAVPSFHAPAPLPGSAVLIVPEKTALPERVLIAPEPFRILNSPLSE